MLGLLIVVALAVAEQPPGSRAEPSLQAGETLFMQFAGENVAIELDTHRVVVGILDERTDDGTVWLKRTSDRMTLWSGFPATRIVSCMVVDQHPRGTDSESDADDGSLTVDCANGCDPLRYDGREAARRITSIQVLAEVANLDGDVESDGLNVWIRPVDRFGDVVAINGQVDFQLLGERRDWRGGRHVPTGPQFLALEQWSQRIQADDVTPDGVHTTLLFRRFHPDQDLDIATNAVLYVRLSVPGRGVFAASDDRLFLRPWSQIRDDLQQRTDSRYFPQERSSLRYLRRSW